jgi:hypothetical protein
MSRKTSTKKAPTCSGRWCETHLFSIHPRYVSLSNPHEYSVRLCPKFNRYPKHHLGKRKSSKKWLPSLTSTESTILPPSFWKKTRYFITDAETLCRPWQKQFAQFPAKNTYWGGVTQRNSKLYSHNSQELCLLFANLMQMIPNVNS